jgi:hypothetical protein
MATELNNERPIFTNEQKEAWNKAKLLLKTFAGSDTVRYRALHIAMSELRGRYRKHKGPIEAPSKNPNKLQQRLSCDKNAQLRERIDSWKVYFDNPGAKKLYIICDYTLSESQKAVQSAHAAAQFLKEHPLAPWVNGTLVLLQSSDKYQSTKYMCDTFQKFSDRYYTWRWLFKTEWREPDMDNALTAIAVLDDFNVIDNKEYSTAKML